MALTKRQRQEVWDKSGGHCWYCGCKLPENGWHADHVEAVYRDINPIKHTPSYAFGPVPSEIKKMLNDQGMQKPQNDTIGNTVPACAPCNLFKSTLCVEDFRREIERQADRARKYSVNFRTAERFGLVEAKIKPVVFWFEK